MRGSPAGNSARSRKTKGLMTSPRSDGLTSLVMGPRVCPCVRYAISRTGCWICRASMVVLLLSGRLRGSRGLDGRRSHAFHFELDVDAIADQHAARLEHLVPLETEVLAVEGGLRDEADALVAPGIFGATAVLDVERDWAGHVADRE